MNVDFQKLIEEGQKKEQERIAHELFEKQIEFQSRIFDKAAHHNNLVVTFAYASFFAIWIWARDFLTTADAKLSIFLISISLMGFVFWTLLSSYRISTAHSRVSNILTAQGKSASTILEDWEKFSQEMRKKELSYIASWGWIFTITFTIGMLSGVILLIMVLLSFLDVNFSIGEFLLGCFDKK